MSRLRATLQLIRLPNVFTAVADVGLAAFAVRAHGGQWAVVGVLALASACLYCGGMVWNDFFDMEQDRRERPGRPIPSGRFSRRAAGALGTVLLVSGFLLAGVAGALKGVVAPQVGGSAWTPALVAACLAAAVLLYDGVFKRTLAGPLLMGSCRFLNVLLGLSAGPGFTAWQVQLAAVVGLYIVGVTWLARTEAVKSRPGDLAGAAGCMLVSLVIALAVPVRLAGDGVSPFFPYLLVALGFLVGLPVYRAVRVPSPAHVQAAVKRSLMGLVVLDAVLGTAFVGLAALTLLLLLVPVVYLARRPWMYMT
jgi:4-hydroxybenzoate polyprenyltransferase